MVVKNEISTTQLSDKKIDMNEVPADFESAISASGFGWFNLLLFLATLNSVFASQFETTALSYVFPAAQCDLNLSLEDRGLINAVIYIGMITSCFIWGFLVDIFGRRKILYILHLLDVVFVLMAAFSTNVSMLLVAKFFGGFIINGASMGLSPYLSELHTMMYRSRVPLTIGLLFSFSNIVLPLLGWIVLPSNLKLTIYGDFELHAWNIFLLFCTLPGIGAGILFFTLPESPKYFMSKGNNDKALQIFKRIFQINKRQPQDNYPFTKLKDEKQVSEKKRDLKQSWEQIRPLFSLKYFKNLAMVCTLIFSLMLSVNAFRLWLPQIFQIVNDYSSDSMSFCDILKHVDTIGGSETTCFVNFDNSSVYINSVIVAVSAVIGYTCAAVCVNKIGKKRLLVSLGIISGISVTSIYFSPNPTVALVLICVFMAFSCICIDIIITIAVDLFPTSLRATALSLSFMSGRLGSIVGNLIFPILLQISCAGIFFTLGFLLTGCAILSLFLPNTDFKTLD